MQATILLVEDEVEVREMVHRVLAREGFNMLTAADAGEGHRRISERVPDLMLVDWMLPSVSGIEFVRRCKRDDLTADVPVIMLTARAEENDRVHGLESGADDYSSTVGAVQKRKSRSYVQTAGLRFKAKERRSPEPERKPGTWKSTASRHHPSDIVPAARRRRSCIKWCRAISRPCWRRRTTGARPFPPTPSARSGAISNAASSRTASPARAVATAATTSWSPSPARAAGSAPPATVRVVDGSTVTMPDTPDNQAAFPQQGGQATGLGFPICRFVGVTCLDSGALLNAAVGRFQGKGGDVQTLLRSLVDTFACGDVVLGDAFFATWFLIADLQTRGVDVPFEQNGARRRSTDFRRGRRFGTRDHHDHMAPAEGPSGMDVSPEQYAAAPESITVRELKTGRRILVTTMLCPNAFPIKALKEPYKSRWNVELDIRSIKTTLGMEALSCRTPEMAEKEIWIHLLAYNLIRTLMFQSARSADILPRMLSFRHALQLWLAWSRSSPMFDEHELVHLLQLIAQQRVGHRPGRVEPRAVKRRPKAFPQLTQPRPEAREKIRRHGHPAKVK